MKRIILLSALLIIACDENVPEDGLAFDPDQQQVLRSIESDTVVVALGESVMVGESSVEAGFSGILSDSRCPMDAVCFWEGRARIGFWLKAPGQDTVFLEPTIPGFMDTTSTVHTMSLSEQYGVTLLQLDPYPRVDTAGVDLGDTLAYLLVEEFTPLLSQSEIILLDGDDYYQLSSQPNEHFYIDSLSLVEDTLLVHLKYSGGCNEHDFFTFGSLGWRESYPPGMPVTIIHHGYDDACDAIIGKTLSIDLTPVKELTGYGNTVFIDIGWAPYPVLYTW